ncbi:LytTR family DNA-binding domain-containing protein [Pricia sp. S334]|uniref:LytTR family DNA-binding domain-containing protein n=1 Tax=Pricia mediterranea TaxID=3076079 RepID=A0ABU3L199_9FLAO|nr:LytTR family DNA-binding domain-containing protein [Pricia sp. S334]MDT7827504.1 LytTR family DNA-binding domain-containing protein [Pricia sp. S334]
MKVLIIEDELAASDNLAYLLQSIDRNIEVIAVLDSVKASVDFFSKPHEAELVFMDIHLADGISFEIFERTSIDVPVIFTTAYNQYALKAFKFNSIDYLLKPIDKDELADALQQFKIQNSEKSIDDRQVKGLLDLIQTERKNYKTTFLVGLRDQLIPLKTDNIAYFRIDTGIVKAITSDNKSYTVDEKLEDIEKELNPENFYRANRQFIIHREAVVNLKAYFNGKLIVEVTPVCDERIVVSKAKASEFKEWMEN